MFCPLTSKSPFPMFDRLPERERNVEVFPARAWPTKQSFTEWSGCTPWGRSRVPLGSRWGPIGAVKGWVTGKYFMVTGEFLPMVVVRKFQSLSIVMGNKCEINMESVSCCVFPEQFEIVFQPLGATSLFHSRAERTHGSRAWKSRRECQSHLLDSVKTSVYIVYTTSVWILLIWIGYLIWFVYTSRYDMIWSGPVCVNLWTNSIAISNVNRTSMPVGSSRGLTSNFRESTGQP